MDAALAGEPGAPTSGAELARQIAGALRASGLRLPFYEQLLADALQACAPPFATRAYGALYAERAADPQWLARSIVTNAKKEAEGARVLWRMAGEVAHTTIRSAVRQHAVDESNHARYYVRLLHLAFPGCAQGEVDAKLNALSPGYSSREEPVRAEQPDAFFVTLDELVQMNIGEIRTRIHQQLLRPLVSSYAPPSNRRRVLAVTDRLMADETKHIAYTAEVLERAAASGHERVIRERMARRYEQFCVLTRSELGRSAFEGS